MTKFLVLSLIAAFDIVFVIAATDSWQTGDTLTAVLAVILFVAVTTLPLWIMQFVALFERRTPQDADRDTDTIYLPVQTYLAALDAISERMRSPDPHIRQLAGEIYDAFSQNVRMIR